MEISDCSTKLMKDLMGTVNAIQPEITANCFKRVLFYVGDDMEQSNYGETVTPISEQESQSNTPMESQEMSSSDAMTEEKPKDLLQEDIKVENNNFPEEIKEEPLYDGYSDFSMSQMEYTLLNDEYFENIKLEPVEDV